MQHYVVGIHEVPVKDPVEDWIVREPDQRTGAGGGDRRDHARPQRCGAETHEGVWPELECPPDGREEDLALVLNTR